MSENNQSHITLYTLIGDYSKVKQVLIEQFADVTKTVQDGDIWVLRRQDELEYPEKICDVSKMADWCE